MLPANTMSRNSSHTWDIPDSSHTFVPKALEREYEVIHCSLFIRA